jgi:DNA polymerase elongation subunit (family B)
MFYVDRFDEEALNDTRLNFMYKWAFSLRVCMKAVYRESVNRYAQGLSDRVNHGLNMFSLISEMQSPMELDTIILENVSEEMFKNSKINVNKYKKMYDSLFGKEAE